MSVFEPARMQAHPEGGRYCEVFRSDRHVSTAAGDDRSAATHIYFALEPGEVSVFHRVRSDEIWNLYEGDGLRLYLLEKEGAEVQEIELSASARRHCHVVPAGWWQAARPVAGAQRTVLAGCTVAPGFEFSDFELMTADSPCGQYLRAMGNRYADLLR